MTVSLVARRHGVAPNQLFTWRRLVAQGGEIAPEVTGHGLPLSKCEAYNRVYDQPC
jgi:transposase